jgi:CheY-like chemotaxis protein
MDVTMETLAVRRVCIPMDGIGPFEPRPAETRSVLLVTGDADLRAVGARVLGREGYHVVTAAHSGHAQLACRTASRPFDILITELSLDEMSGPALTETLRQAQPALRAVYLADAGAPAGDGVIVRPFTRDDLLMEIDTVCADVTSTSTAS